MTLAPAAVLSPSMMKLSGTTMLEETEPGMGWPVVVVWVDDGIVLGRSWATYRTVVVGAFWLESRSTLRPALWEVSVASPNWSSMPGASWIV